MKSVFQYEGCTLNSPLNAQAYLNYKHVHLHLTPEIQFHYSTSVIPAVFRDSISTIPVVSDGSITSVIEEAWYRVMVFSIKSYSYDDAKNEYTNICTNGQKSQAHDCPHRCFLFVTTQ